MVSIRWSFETITLSRMIVEILCQTLSQAHSHGNALIPILGGKVGGCSILQLPVYSRSVVTPFELLTAIVGPRDSLLRCSDLLINPYPGPGVGKYTPSVVFAVNRTVSN